MWGVNISTCLRDDVGTETVVMHSVLAHFVETQLPWLPQQVTAHQSGTAILRHLLHCGKMIAWCTALYTLWCNKSKPDGRACYSRVPLSPSTGCTPGSARKIMSPCNAQCLRGSWPSMTDNLPAFRSSFSWLTTSTIVSYGWWGFSSWCCYSC